MRRGDVANSRAFDGVTFSVKDVEDVAGLPTTHSCEALAGNVAVGRGRLTFDKRRPLAEPETTSGYPGQ